MSAELQTVRIARGLDFQKRFLRVFNEISNNYHLVPSNQEFDIFDYYLFKQGEVEPYLIELKTRPGKTHNQFGETLFDYLKLLKLRNLSRKTKVFIVFEDTTVIIDTNELPEGVIVGQYDNHEKPVALYSVSKLKKLDVSLEILRSIE